MSDKPQLDLGNPPAGLARQRNSTRGVWLLAVLQLATLGVVVAMLTGTVGRTGAEGVNADQAEEIRAAAISLEERSLAAEAATAWQEYLRLVPNATDRSEICYRVGSLLMDAEDFSGAVVSFVAAEQSAQAQEDLNQKIGPKIVECLRRLGKYGEVGRELSRQIEVGGENESQGAVLATFAGEELTDADLDRMIENTVDRLLAMQPGGMPINREQLIKRYESAEARQQVLQEILQRELFTRRARELDLHREPSFQQAREYLETELLAGKFLAQELGKIAPTQVDIESYFAANRMAYRRPETAAVVVLPLKPEQSVNEVLASITSADDFLARAAMGDEKAATIKVTEGSSESGFVNPTPLFRLSQNEWTRVPLEWNGQNVLALLDSKSGGEVPELDQIRMQVESDYRRRKQQELTQKLSADLMQRYDVKISARPANPSDSGDASKLGDSVSEDANEVSETE